MGEGKKTVGERKPFPRLLGASAWHLISRWELLTFRWPTCHRRRGGYLVFAFPAFVPRRREGRPGTMNRVNHFRVFNYSAHVLANMGRRRRPVYSNLADRFSPRPRMDGFIRSQLSIGPRVIVRFHARQRNYAPIEICRPRSSLNLGPSVYFGGKNRGGRGRVNNSIGVSHVLEPCNFRSVVNSRER